MIKRFQKLVALALVLVMALGLASCGKGGGESGEGGGGGSGSSAGGGKNNPNAELAKQYVFSADEIALPEMGDEQYIQGIDYVNDRIFVVMNVVTYAGGGGGGVTYGMDAGDVAAAAVINVSAVEEPAVDEPSDTVQEEEWQEPKNEWFVLSFDKEGNDMQTLKLDAPAQDYVYEESEDGYYSSSTNYSQMAVSGDNCIYGVKDSWWNESHGDEYTGGETYELVCWGEDGQTKWSTVLTETSNDSQGWVYVSTVKVADDGTVYVLLQGDTPRALIFDKDGNQTSEKELDPETMNYMQSAYVDDAGVMHVLCMNEEYTKELYMTIDMKTGEASEKKEMPDIVNRFGNAQEGPNGKFVMSDYSSGLYFCDPAAGTVEQVMSFINSDLDASSLRYSLFLDEEHFVASYYSYLDDGTSRMVVALFTRVPPEDVPDKTVLVLGCNYLGSDYRRRIVNFNKNSDLYRITVKDYSQYAAMDDYMASYTQLNNDIVSGSMPDILIADSNIPIDNYIAKGLIADVGALLEADEELSGVEFMQNVFDAYSVDGKLYYVVPCFCIETAIAKKSIVGDRTSWTMQEFMDLLAAMPEGTMGFGQMVRSAFMYYVLQYNGSRFIDPASGKCSFDSQEFIDILEYTATLPETIEYDEDYDWTLEQTMYADERAIAETTAIYDTRTLNRDRYGIFGGDEIVLIGFPCAEGNGSVVQGQSMLVLSSKSVALEGAWEFARYYLTEDYQKQVLDWGNMPVNKALLKEMLQKATERPYWENEDGEKEYYDATLYVGDEEIVVPPMTQEEVDEVLSFIESVNRASYSNNEIQSIIEEEAAPFYAGQKTAEEVAGIIQSRIQILVNESR